jgi:hypothetical protein
MKRPALLRAFCGQWIAERQSSDFIQAARFRRRANFTYCCVFFAAFCDK